MAYIPKNLLVECKALPTLKDTLKGAAKTGTVEYGIVGGLNALTTLVHRGMDMILDPIVEQMRKSTGQQTIEQDVQNIDQNVFDEWYAGLSAKEKLEARMLIKKYWDSQKKGGE